MIYRSETLNVTVNERMRGGDGSVTIKKLLDADGLYDKGRLFAHLMLKKGCSIGCHRHEGEMEAFYVLRGVATFTDDGAEAELRPGDVAYTPDGGNHAVANNGEEDLEMMALIIKK